MFESPVTKMGVQNRLSGATSHHHVATEGCRWTVNLPKGHMSSSEVEVKKDREGEEFLEVTCGDNNALLYIARLSQGSKGVKLYVVICLSIIFWTVFLYLMHTINGIKINTRVTKTKYFNYDNIALKLRDKLV